MRYKALLVGITIWIFLFACIPVQVRGDTAQVFYIGTLYYRMDSTTVTLNKTSFTTTFPKYAVYGDEYGHITIIENQTRELTPAPYKMIVWRLNIASLINATLILDLVPIFLIYNTTENTIFNEFVNATKYIPQRKHSAIFAYSSHVEISLEYTQTISINMSILTNNTRKDITNVTLGIIIHRSFINAGSNIWYISHARNTVIYVFNSTYLYRSTTIHLEYGSLDMNAYENWQENIKSTTENPDRTVETSIPYIEYVEICLIVSAIVLVGIAIYGVLREYFNKKLIKAIQETKN